MQIANATIAAAIKKFKPIGIVVSILLIICGILIFSTPVGSGIVFTWVMMGTLLVNGAYRLVRYFFLPKEVRNGWMLGISLCVFGITTLIECICAKD